MDEDDFLYGEESAGKVRGKNPPERNKRKRTLHIHIILISFMYLKTKKE